MKLQTRNRFVLLTISVLLLVSCGDQHFHQEYVSRDGSIQKLADYNKAQGALSRLHEGMTFTQVSQVLPVLNDKIPMNVTHGGYWCRVSVSVGYDIQLRFERPRDNLPISECKLNLPPELIKQTITN